jgi:hypothetical protein
MVLTPDDEADRDLQRHGIGHAALLAFVDVVLQLQRHRVTADVTDVAARLIGRAALRAEHVLVAVGIGDQRMTTRLAGLSQVMQPLQLAALTFPVADRVFDELER